MEIFECLRIFYIILLYLQTEFRYTKCSLLSRIKNPVEHLILTITTPETSVLPNNVYKYEPYRVYRTLWRPTSSEKASSNEDSKASTVHRKRPWLNQQNRPQEVTQPMEVSAKKSFWHHFEEDDAAWPKVVLVVSSTEKTTTTIKVKKTFASYFPHLNYRSTEITAYKDDQNDTEKDDDEKMNPINFESIGERFVYTEDDDEIHESGDNIDITSGVTSDKICRTPTMAAITARREGGDETKEAWKTGDNKEPKHVREGGDMKEAPRNMKGEDKREAKQELREGGNTVTTTSTNTTRSPRCYQCGLIGEENPIYPTCYHIFESNSPVFYHKRHKFKVICGGAEKNAYKPPSPSVPYKDGCFKRFLDIGSTYNERGCRTMPPLRGSSLVSDRLMGLELTIHALTDGCVSSPYASLTPFSRSISLWARYHVCVCVGRYCNGGNPLHTNYLILIFLSVLSCILHISPLSCSVLLI